ncbi:MAG: multiheme c-type cytochrome, partial [Shewanella sp.]
MMKRFNFNTATKAMLGAGLLSLLLAGCGGSDGNDGEDGKPGEIALTINDVTNVVTKVDTANFNEATKTLTVEFNLTNANGVAITGLETLKDPIRLAFGRMGNRGETFKPFKVGDKDVTATADADEAIWLSYNNKLNTTTGLHSGTANWRPNTNCPEGNQCLEYLGQGKYKITAANIINTNGLDYGYDATKIQGLYLITYEAGANKVRNTEMYYWNPADGKKVSSPRTEMTEQTCTNCHVAQDHIRHSNYGNTAEQCGFCHTDYTQYQKVKKDTEGNDITVTYNGSTKGLVHGFHVGATETNRRKVAKFGSTIASGAVKNPAFTYIFDRATATAEGKPLNFPASAANCEACHVSSATTVDTLPSGLSPLALAWFADTDVNSCQTCHGDYHYGSRTKDNPVDPTNPESPTVTTLTGCVECHSSYDGNTRGGAFRHFAGANKDSHQAASQAGLLLTTS